MTVEKRFDVEDATFWFKKETDNSENLICQKENIYLKKYKIQETETFLKIDKADESILLEDNKYLCHVTSDDRIGDILENGLIPHVGDIYKGYWLKGIECKELLDLFEPGIFLMRNEKSFKAYLKNSIKLYIDPFNLDLGKLYVDHAFPNNKSMFYTGTIPPEYLFIKIRKEGKTQLLQLSQKYTPQHCQCQNKTTIQSP